MSVFHTITRIVVKHCSRFRFQSDRIQLPRVCYRLTVSSILFFFPPPPRSQWRLAFVFDVFVCQATMFIIAICKIVAANAKITLLYVMLYFVGRVYHEVYHEQNG